MNQLFIIGPRVFHAVSIEETQATIAALKELDLCKLPYDKVDVQFLFDDIAVCRDTGLKFAEELGPEAAVRFTNVTLDGYGDVFSIWANKPVENITCEVGDTYPQFIAEFLITVLATRNIVKHTVERKSVKLGIGKKNNRYRYSTTISLPDELEDCSEHSTQGQPKCPHLRRGHIRRQHYGPHNSFIKKIWIQPVFVNADENYVSTRTHYNLGG